MWVILSPTSHLSSSPSARHMVFDAAVGLPHQVVTLGSEGSIVGSIPSVHPTAALLPS